DMAGFAQSFTDCRHHMSARPWRTAVEISDHRHCRLLRARRERPRPRATEQRDERSPVHCLIPLVLSTERIAQRGTEGVCCAAGFQLGLCRLGVDFVAKVFLHSRSKFLLAVQATSM